MCFHHASLDNLGKVLRRMLLQDRPLPLASRPNLCLRGDLPDLRL